MHTESVLCCNLTVKMETQTRPLCLYDRVCFLNCFSPLSTIVTFPTKGTLWRFTQSDAKLQRAFGEVVQNTPLLQTQVVGQGDEAMFQKVKPSQYPTMVIESEHYKSYEAMLDRARSVKAEWNATLTQGGQDACRLPIHFVAVRGPRHVALVLVAPHHFCDGVAITSIFARLFVTQLLPMWAWRFLRDPDRHVLPRALVEKDILEKIYSINVHDTDTCLSKKYAPDNFRFVDFDPTLPDASSHLRGTKEIMATVSIREMDQLRKSLRSNGQLSLTTALYALAVQVYAKLLDEYCPGLAANKKILAMVAMDGRRLGQWNHEKQKNSKKKKKKLFETVADYAVGPYLQIPYEDALHSPLEQVAQTVKQFVAKVRKDVNQQIHEIAANAAFVPTEDPVFCGVSSLPAPRIMQTLGIFRAAATLTVWTLDRHRIVGFMSFRMGSTPSLLPT